MKATLLTLLLLTNLNSKDINQDANRSFVLKTANRDSIEIKELKGGVAFQHAKDKVTVLTFIAYNGRPCLYLIEILNNLKKAHSDFEVFAVEMRGLKGEKLKKFAKDKSIEFPIIGYENAKEFTKYIASKAGWNGSMPFILVLDKKGIVKYIQIGVIPQDGFEKLYHKLKESK
jgi:peroxiredoxin